MFHDDDNFFDPHEYDDLLESSRIALAKDIIEHTKKNKDHGIKHVGDRVLVWDASRLTDVESGKVNFDEFEHALLERFPSIVIENGCKFKADLVIGERVYPMNLDLIVWNKTLNKKFRTNSKFVKRTDKPE